VISRNFKPGFRIRLHQKDLSKRFAGSRVNEGQPPFTSAIQQILIALMNQGKGVIWNTFRDSPHLSKRWQVFKVHNRRLDSVEDAIAVWFAKC